MADQAVKIHADQAVVVVQAAAAALRHLDLYPVALVLLDKVIQVPPELLVHPVTQQAGVAVELDLLLLQSVVAQVAMAALEHSPLY